MTIIYDMVSNEFVEPHDESIAVEARQFSINDMEIPQLRLQEVQFSQSEQKTLPADLAYQAFLKNSS